MSFWNELPKPIIVLAPLADVTDAPFRRTIATYSCHIRKNGTHGGPDVMWTEFVSADGLMRAHEEGKKKLMADLLYTENERPIVAQLFSSEPEYMEGAAKLCKDLGFDGIDINMGCPDRGIERQGCGSAMIKNPKRAQEIIRAAKRGAGGDSGIPVSVKTRIGYNTNELETWLPALLEETPALITVHARTRKEMSKVPANWKRVREAVDIRDAVQNESWLTERGCAYKTLIFGNGDCKDLSDAQQKCETYRADGVMLGRAIFGNPWLFHSEGKRESVPLAERLKVMLEHTRLFEELLPHKSFAVMKKHYKAYANNFDGAVELRAELMETESGDEVEEVVNRFLKSKMLSDSGLVQ